MVEPFEWLDALSCVGLHRDQPARLWACPSSCLPLFADSDTGFATRGWAMVQDIGPRYSGVLLGMSNTAGVLAGVLGTFATGVILQKGSWDEVLLCFF